MKKLYYCFAAVLIAHFTLHIEKCLCQKIHSDISQATVYSPASNGIHFSKGTDYYRVYRTAKNGPVISNLTYDSITQTGVTVFWLTDSPADSKIKWMASDSNYQPIIFTDSIFDSSAVINHSISIINLKPATIYRYIVISQNIDGAAMDSGYFITQSASTGKVEVYFNHTVDTTVSQGESAKGSQNFANLFVKQIDSAKFSIDVTLWEFEYYTSISNALINAKIAE